MLSLVIPHMPSPEADAALDRCVESFKGQYDELIIISNDGMGYGAAVNLGLKYSTCDYILVSNNDIELKSGKLKWLCWRAGISVPLIDPQPRDYLPRAIFAMHRETYEQILERDGFFYDPIFKAGYFEDDDLHVRTRKLPRFVEVGVKVSHLNGGGLTMKKVGEQQWFDINQMTFNQKWGQDTYSSPYSYPSESSER